MVDEPSVVALDRRTDKTVSYTHLDVYKRQELNVVTKSNDQTGPGASFGVTRNNVFGGGESWNCLLYTSRCV